MSLKLDLTCLNCLKVFHEPIQLPCNHNICGHHINEETQIKCFKCSRIYEINALTQFKPQTKVFPFFKNFQFLNVKEKELKNEIETTLKNIYQLNKEFSQNENS